jgi:pSer/pThr/pTyr-binding forkhead associated (FHA) protein
MGELVIRFKDKVLGSYEIQHGKTMSIGRDKSNDIVIDNLAVSTFHAKIESLGGRFALVDLKSKNGTFVNKKLVSSHWLKDGDIINIGKHGITFSAPDDGTGVKDAPPESLQTMKIDTSDYRSLMILNKQAEALGTSKPLPRKQTKPVGILSDLSDNGSEIVLSKKLVKIGKDPKSDVRVRGLAVAAVAATITELADGWYLSHVGGLFKPKVNNQPVTRSVKLNSLDTIEIGSTKFQFIVRHGEAGR